MSARNPRYVLAPGARRDLRDILKFTEQQWGRAQRQAYRKQLDAAFTQLVRFPGLGNLRPGYGPGVRGHRVGQHVVIYQPSDTELLIVRVLHVRRDHNAELG
jgi:toxin ParE1/3/4